MVPRPIFWLLSPVVFRVIAHDYCPLRGIKLQYSLVRFEPINFLIQIGFVPLRFAAGKQKFTFGLFYEVEGKYFEWNQTLHSGSRLGKDGGWLLELIDAWLKISQGGCHFQGIQCETIDLLQILDSLL